MFLSNWSFFRRNIMSIILDFKLGGSNLCCICFLAMWGLVSGILSYPAFIIATRESWCKDHYLSSTCIIFIFLAILATNWLIYTSSRQFSCILYLLSMHLSSDVWLSLRYMWHWPILLQKYLQTSVMDRCLERFWYNPCVRLPILVHLRLVQFY